MGLRERRYGHERYANSELIERRAVVRVGAGRIGRKFRTQLACIDHRCIRCAKRVAAAFGSATWFQARGRIGQILALTGGDSVRCASASLRCSGRRGMVVKSAMLVVGDEYDGIFPEGTIAHRANRLRYPCLAALDVCRRMLVVLRGSPSQAKVGIDKRNARQIACTGHSRGLREEKSKRQ